MMNNNKTLSNVELPSTKKLLRSTLLAISIAAIILISTVLPAEYGIDPSGVGRILGLTKMGEIKVSLAEEAASIETKSSTDDQLVHETSSSESEVKFQSGVLAISLNPNEGQELKVFMKKDDQIKYSWWTNGAEINFDSHTDSGEYHKYKNGKMNSDQGMLKAVYDGRHGWWWKNRSSEKITITLEVEGQYADLRIEP